jgi:hypothetical protein
VDAEEDGEAPLHAADGLSVDIDLCGSDSLHDGAHV